MRTAYRQSRHNNMGEFGEAPPQPAQRPRVRIPVPRGIRGVDMWEANNTAFVNNLAAEVPPPPPNRAINAEGLTFPDHYVRVAQINSERERPLAGAALWEEVMNTWQPVF